jgi:hypothetical protein
MKHGILKIKKADGLMKNVLVDLSHDSMEYRLWLGLVCCSGKAKTL